MWNTFLSNTTSLVLLMQIPHMSHDAITANPEHLSCLILPPPPHPSLEGLTYIYTVITEFQDDLSDTLKTSQISNFL